MSIRPHLALMLDSLEREIRPDLVTPRSQSAALALSRLLKRMIAYSDGTDHMDTPDAFFGGSAFRHALSNEAYAKINAETGDGFVWAQNMVRWETARYEEVAKRIDGANSVNVPSFGDVETIDGDRLQAYLRSKLNCPNLQITSFASLWGGNSKQTAIFEIDGYDKWPKRLVLRMERQSGIMPSSINREFPILELLHRYGVAVPQAFLVEHSKVALGGAFMVLAALPGKAGIGNFLNPPNRPALARQAAQELGKVHALREEQLESVRGVLARADTRSIAAELETAEEAWVKFGAPWSVCGPFALKWLRRNLHFSEGESRLIHCDADFHNLLADGDKMTAILDWETAQIGNPAYDLGYIRWSIEKILPWAEFIAEYEKAGGPRVPSQQIDFYALWGVMRLAGPLMTRCRQMVEEGSTRQIEYSVVSIEILHRCMHRFASDLSRVSIS